MKKPPMYAELEARVKALEEVNSLLSLALYDITTDAQPDAQISVRVESNVPGDNAQIHGTLYRALAGAGGYVLLSREWYSQAEKRTLKATSVHLLDDLGKTVWPREVREIHQKLTIRRQRLAEMESAKNRG